MNAIPLYVDSDNAMGSRRGDPDDGFALAALFLSRAPLLAVGSVEGNTSEETAARNTQRLGELCGYSGVLLRGFAGGRNEVAPLLVSTPGPFRLIALGPLTNVALAIQKSVQTGTQLQIDEIVIVGSNATSRGRWPPFWPHEFNLTKDRSAASQVFHSPFPLTVIPLDIARRMTVTRGDLEKLDGPIGEYLRVHSQRWFRRARLLKFESVFPVWDLVAALYAINSKGFEINEVFADMSTSAFIHYRGGTRPVRLVRGFDRDILWQRFVDLLEQHNQTRVTTRQKSSDAAG